VVLGVSLVGCRDVGSLAQVLAKSVNGLFPAVVLLEAAPLIVDVREVIGFDEEIPQQIDAFAEVASDTRLLCRFFHRLGGRRSLGGPGGLGRAERNGQKRQDRKKKRATH